MEVKASQEEQMASVLLTGAQTYILNTIANLRDAITKYQEVIDELQKKVKTLESENQALVAELDNRKEE